MKKFLKGLLIAVAIAFVPAVFIAVLLFALNQAFAIGLVLILALLIIQSMLCKKNADAFGWNEYEDFILKNRDGNYKFNLKLNILFNLTKVATVLGIFRLIYLNYSEILNPFGGLGITIFIALTTISILAVSLNKHIRSYEVIRGGLGIIVGLTIVGFVYMTFGTQLIWIPLGVLMIFGMLFGAFKEIEDVMDGKDALSILLPIIISIVTLISTIIQFWSYIAGFFSIIGSFIANVATYELIPSIPVWLMLLSAAFITIVILSAQYTGRKDREKRERLKLQNEKEAKAIEEKKIKDEQRASSEQADKTFKEETLKFIEALSISLKDRSAKKNEVVLLSSAVVKFGYNYLQLFTASALTDIALVQFFIVSELKQQIVWEADFEVVLKMYTALYTRNYEDCDLAKIIGQFEHLVSYINPYKELYGYPQFKDKIEETKIPVTWEK